MELGLVTTPQLHYIAMNNENNASVASYIDNFVNAYIDFQELIKEDCPKQGNYENQIGIDCANGVGSIHLKTLAARLTKYIQIYAFNTDIYNKAVLNSKCGAEFV
jgi:phosphoacetylglucosamine mutase